MALDDYRMLAPQRQIGEPSSLENVIAQAMMSKLSPEMMQGYYLQARGQRQRHAAELGAQQAVATTAGLLASDRTADYKLRGDFAAHPESVAMLMPTGFLPQQQTDIANLHSSYNLLGQKSKADEAIARAFEARANAGLPPASVDPVEGPIGWKLGVPISTQNAGIAAAASMYGANKSSETSIRNTDAILGGRAGIGADANASRERIAAAQQATKLHEIQMRAGNVGALKLDAEARKAGENAVKLLLTDPVYMASVSMPEKQALYDARFKAARDDYILTHSAASSAAAITGPLPATLPAGANPLAATVDVGNAANAAQGKAPDPTAPSPATPSHAPAATPPPTAAVNPATDATVTGNVDASQTVYAEAAARVKAAGGRITKMEMQKGVPVVKWIAKDGSLHISTPTSDH